MEVVGELIADLEALIFKQLIALARQELRFDWCGIYGAPHWSRVSRNGLNETEQTGANRKLVELELLMEARRGMVMAILWRTLRSRHAGIPIDWTWGVWVSDPRGLRTTQNPNAVFLQEAYNRSILR